MRAVARYSAIFLPSISISNSATRAHFMPRTVFAASATAFSAALAKLSLEEPTTSMTFWAMNASSHRTEIYRFPASTVWYVPTLPVLIEGRLFMPTKCRPKSVKTEAQMSQAVACNLGKYAAREVRVGDCIFDVVAYNKKEKLFRLVECKRSRKASAIGHAFGQVAVYSATIAAHGRDFVVAYSK